MKKTVYIYEKEAVLYKEGPQLAVRIHETVIYNEPFSNIDSVVIFKRAQITTQCLCALLNHGAPVIYTTRSAKIIGCTYPRYTERPLLKLAQYRYLEDQEACLNIAKTLVSAKIAGQIKTLNSYRNKSAIKIKRMGMKVSRATSVSQLLGLEGSVASAYFSAFAQCLTKLSFTKRDTHPAHDPVNALLNLTYMLALYKIDCVLFAHGFDTTLGFIHTTFRDRTSLSLDVLEPFRGLLDRFVLKLINLSQIKEDDFEITENGCLLTKKGFQSYIEKFSDLVDILEPAEEVAERLKRAMHNQEASRFDLTELLGML